MAQVHGLGPRVGGRLALFCIHRMNRVYGARSELQTQLSYVVSRPHLSHILTLPSQRLGRYQITHAFKYRKSPELTVTQLINYLHH